MKWFKNINKRLSNVEERVPRIRSGYAIVYRLCKKCERKTLQIQINNNEVYDCCICGTRWALGDVEVKLPGYRPNS